MWAVWPASCQAVRRRLNLIESGWLVLIPCGSGGCHPVCPKRVEGATLFEQLPATPLRSGWGLTRLTG